MPYPNNPPNKVHCNKCGRWIHKDLLAFDACQSRSTVASGLMCLESDYCRLSKHLAESQPDSLVNLCDWQA